MTESIKPFTKSILVLSHPDPATDNLCCVNLQLQERQHRVFDFGVSHTGQATRIPATHMLFPPKIVVLLDDSTIYRPHAFKLLHSSPRLLGLLTASLPVQPPRAITWTLTAE